MELLQLRYFCITAKHQSITRAASELMISQPALSKTIIALEKELGVPLFERRNRSIYLNHAGELFYQKIERSIKLMDDAVDELQALSEEPHGRIKLLILAASAYMPKFYIAFHRRYPKIQLQLSNYIQHQHLSMYDCDFYFSTGDTHIPLFGGRTIPILTERLCLAVHKNHPLAERKAIHLQEAASYPFVASNQKAELELQCLKAGFHPNIIAECDNGTTFEALLKNGLGISIIPEITLGSLLTEDIVCVPLLSPQLTRTITLSYDSKRHMSETNRLFLDFCKEYFRLPETDTETPLP